jgi:hypothetical protein
VKEVAKQKQLNESTKTQKGLMTGEQRKMEKVML